MNYLEHTSKPCAAGNVRALGIEKRLFHRASLAATP